MNQLSTADSELAAFHPAIRDWFGAAFPQPTEAQRLAWPPITRGINTLLLAPTGSGKTLSAFLFAINCIVFPKMFPPPQRAKKSKPKGFVKTLYLSPLKALGVDVERNLRSPLAGIRAVAERDGHDYYWPTVGIRSGDTPAAERRRMLKDVPDILITTPESLFLLLTSQAREILSQVETVIVDEIHTMVGTKRGAHLFLTLERLEAWRHQNKISRPLQRIGLSATIRPLDEVARLLGGYTATSREDERPQPRPVEIVQAGRRRSMELTVEVPVEDMARLAEPAPVTDVAGSASGPSIPSIWPAIHPRLVELIRGHQTTMIFVNSRRLAERLAQSINESADEELAAAHHGSIAKDTRLLIEDRLKRGQLPAIVATSSLELGIDMGAVDLVIQIEAPPSIASGIQRVGRAGHQVDAASVGIIFPKYRGDLLACSAAVQRMFAGEVESSRYPRNPLDVLAQQLAAMVALEPWSVNELYQLVRSAAPFSELSRSILESVLDLLAGRYPSTEFSELRARLDWDRTRDVVSSRRGTQRVAIANAGTIPDRGLYGVYLASGGGTSSRVGELDEEMVFETNPGDVFLLGASSWRALEITHDRVIVEPAPGEPGRMPFWRGEGPGRPLEFGQAIGRLTHTLARQSAEESQTQLCREHGLTAQAAENLVKYVADQIEATEEVPSDRTIIVEQFLDEIGDWRIALLTPFGKRVHAPWAMAVAARLRGEQDREVDMIWGDDGMVFRLPATDELPDVDLFFPDPDEIESVIVKELGGTSLFATRFRENAARALLLPRRQPGKRTPLWLQRRRSADLLNVAAKYDQFPMILETYRECLRDVFDLPGLRRLLRDIVRRDIRVREVRSQIPSPFASALLFDYAANFLYNGDAPLAERRAAALALDLNQLREILGEADLRDLLDPLVVEEVEEQLQRRESRWALKDAEAVHDLLRWMGDLSRQELAAWPREEALELNAAVDDLAKKKRVVECTIAGEMRWIAVEDAARYRDAFGIVPPQGIASVFLEPVEDALIDLVARYARTHIPFTTKDVAHRFGIGESVVMTTLQTLARSDRVLEGEFLPGGSGREWCDASVLRRLKQRSLARLRAEIEPVEMKHYARFLVSWQGIERPRKGCDGLLDVIEQLQGVPLPFSSWESRVLPARVSDFQPAMLDELCTAGEVIWRGMSGTTARDGRVALFLTDQAGLLSSTVQPPEDPVAVAILEYLKTTGAVFSDAILRGVGGFPPDVEQALWSLVWSGHITNDTFGCLRRQRQRGGSAGRGRRRERGAARRFRSRRALKGNASVTRQAGRWSPWPDPGIITPTEKRTALAQVLLERYGVLTREAVTAEGHAGGFSGIYPVLKAFEEAGRVRRGYFVAGQGAAQFAAAGAEDKLRAGSREAEATISSQTPQAQVLASVDPANPYGAALRWPQDDENDGGRPQRVPGALVVLVDGELRGYLNRSGRKLSTFLPEDEPERSAHWRAMMQALIEDTSGQDRTLQLTEVDGLTISQSPWMSSLRDLGFLAYSDGYRHRQK